MVKITDHFIGWCHLVIIIIFLGFGKSQYLDVCISVWLVFAKSVSATHSLNLKHELCVMAFKW